MPCVCSFDQDSGASCDWGALSRRRCDLSGGRDRKMPTQKIHVISPTSAAFWKRKVGGALPGYSCRVASSSRNPSNGSRTASRLSAVRLRAIHTDDRDRRDQEGKVNGLRVHVLADQTRGGARSMPAPIRRKGRRAFFNIGIRPTIPTAHSVGGRHTQQWRRVA